LHLVSLRDIGSRKAGRLLHSPTPLDGVTLPPHHLLAVTLLSAVACGAPPTAVRTDVLAYLQRSKAWAPIEAETARTIDRILKTHFVDDAEIHRLIADDRPRVLSHVETVRAYRPGTRAVAQVHEQYLAAWSTLLLGYDAIEEGFRTGDYAHLARGREAMLQWRRQIVHVADQLRSMTDHFGIDPSEAAHASRGPPNDS
jgi:hypothetical protein